MSSASLGFPTFFDLGVTNCDASTAYPLLVDVEFYDFLSVDVMKSVPRI